MQQPCGWTGKILNVDLTQRRVTHIDTFAYTKRFIGGLGIGQKIYWETTAPETQAFDPQNPLILMTGPLCGTTAPSAPRMVVCGKSPCTYPERFVSASIAGFFPAELKKAGYDGLVVIGRADAPVYLNIDDGKVAVKDAALLWGLTTEQTREAVQRESGASAKVLTIGPGGEGRTRIGNLIGDSGSSASMGFGSLMGAKHLKAVAVTGSGRPRVADPDGVKYVRDRLKEMTGPGYHNIYGQAMPLPGDELVKKVHCHSCPQGCWRSLQRRASGLEGIRKCHMGSFYAKWDMKLHGRVTDAAFLAAGRANDCGLCADELLFLMLWLEQCLEQGLLAEREVGLPISRMGSLEFVEALLSRISGREGFGSVLAEGTVRAAKAVGPEAQAVAASFLTQSGRPARTYGPKSFIISAPVFAVEQRPAITTLHEICSPLTKWALWLKTNGRDSYVSTDVLRRIAERFWGGSDAVDFSTSAGKARAAKIIQDRQHAKECLVLCDLVWPVLDDAGTESHVGDPALESRLLSAVTGQSFSEQALGAAGERVFNLNRAIQLRDGRGGRADDVLSETYFIEREEAPADIFDIYNPERYLPGRADELISHKGKAVDRTEVKMIMDEYYEIRGWDPEGGLPKKETLRHLNLEDIIDPLGGKVV